MNDLPVGRSVDETLRLLKAFQFTDIHGEVCCSSAKGSLSHSTAVFDRCLIEMLASRHL